MIPCRSIAILIEKLNNIFEKNLDIQIIQMYGKILTDVSMSISQSARNGPFI